MYTERIGKTRTISKYIKNVAQIYTEEKNIKRKRERRKIDRV